MAIEFNKYNHPQGDNGPPVNPTFSSSILPGSEDDDDDGSSDTSSVLTELEADDFPDHFREHGGRLFHSHGNLPYPLPVDGHEQRRLNLQHKVLRELLGAHFVGPVDQLLANEPGRQKRVLDLCTGTGQWVMDMASDFTHVRFSGVDIVPIATRLPHPNAHFEMLDVTQRLRWPDGVMDLVHARNISLAVPNYHEMLREAARVLRRGGIFFSGEVGRNVAFAPGYPGNPAVDAPGATRFLKVVNDVLASIGLDDITSRIPRWVREVGAFTGGGMREYVIPIGGWHPSSARQRNMGRMYLVAMSMFAESLKPLLRDQGHLTEPEISELVEGYLHDMHTIPGLVSVYHTMWTIKA